MSGTFHAAFPTADLRGAEYNPRIIDTGALEHLRESIRTLGFSKPIIVTEGGLIVAGHQRTKAARAEGIEHVPAWVLPAISTTDEVRFNQLHNGTDADAIDFPVTVEVTSLPVGEFHLVAPGAVACNVKSEGAAVRNAIAELLVKYGNWGGAVATESGEVLSGQQYAVACHQLAIRPRIFLIPDELRQAALDAFGRQYGRFSYDHLRKTTWLQTFAQMHRLRADEGADRKQNASTLYEKHVIPALQSGERVLDFGCGQGDYVKRLQRQGHRIIGVEFFARRGGLLDTAKVHRDIDLLASQLRRRGLFDVVVCDSVLNSVDSQQAEEDVMHSVAALVRPGGRVYFSGRRTERLDNYRKHRVSATVRKRAIEFPDENGLTAIFRKGDWFYQKFHTHEQTLAIAHRYFGEQVATSYTSTSWQVAVTAEVGHREAVLEAALRREFNLPWPEGRTVDRADLIVAAWKSAAFNQGVAAA